ncbi:MAG: 23S rRNA (adenine(2503)-C(2))-methyltransferase RlmN [Acidimicrobiia bacterium]|nr:MAG: 23S rRNA (adenine(2503)-C(2))-methyltransferase RlmN [Acidimicrobiia bacterium]
MWRTGSPRPRPGPGTRKPHQRTGQPPYDGAVLYLTDPEELASIWPEEPGYRADQLRGWLYETPVLTTDEMTNIPGLLREDLELWPFEVEAEQVADSGRTVKWLMRAPDGASIEAVLMGYAKRTTLCISSQAGCAMACTFCATGQFGFERHLEAGEIVAQVAYAAAFLRRHGLGSSPPRVTNLVFMGMGEPLANYRHVKTAIDRLTGTMGMSARSITVSTVGVAPAIRRLAEEPWRVSLAVSLHAADDELRSTLVPLNKRYPLEEVIAATEYFMDETGRRPSIEWTLIAGTNDTMDQADRLARIARRLRSHINVIALNPTPLTADQPPTATATRAFIDRLTSAGANVTLRDTRGQDIDAACGQLRARQMTVEP